jgi:long-chain acyl-CoA synthetase
MAARESRRIDSVLDLADDAARRLGERRVMALLTDDGLAFEWSAAEIGRRSVLAAWRLRAAGLEPGERLLVWSQSTPELAALYIAAVRAGVVVVPLDLRMSPEIVRRIAADADARSLVVGSTTPGLDLASVGLDHFPQLPLSELMAPDGGKLPAGWAAQVESWPRPGPSDVYQIVYTSGTTGHPRGVVISHSNVIANVDACPATVPVRALRVLSLAPLSHFGGQLELFVLLSWGGDILYVRSRTPRILFDAMRQHRMTVMGVVPAMLDLFWQTVTRNIGDGPPRAAFERRRRIARRLPYVARRWLFRRMLEPLGGHLRLFGCSSAFLPPTLQGAWEDLGIIVTQGYGSTECGLAATTTYRQHPPGRLGKPQAPNQLELADDGEILVSGPTVAGGYWHDPGATARAFDEQGRHHTGDIGRLDEHGDLILVGRKKNIIVLPNGINVFPEDVENALHAAGLGDVVVVETSPGRIEAVVLDPDRRTAGGGTGERTAAEATALHARINAAVRTANAALTVHERVDSWRLWPEPEFPRTHSMKIKRDPVRAWATSALSVPLPVREGAET